MKNFINWKMFFVLLGLTMISIICVFPYILSVQGELLSKIGQPIEIIFFAQLIQSLILFSVAIFFGLFFAKKFNFKLPLIQAVLEKKDYRETLKSILGTSIFSGIIVAIAIYVLDMLFTMQGVVISTHQNYAPIWQKLLASVYGGVAEEILMRLFFMMLFVWVSVKLFKQIEPSKINIMISIFLAAIIFGLGHLPITASITTITPIVVTRAIVLNGIGGVGFGWLFWKKGLESAIIAHFTADIFLLTLLPLIFSN